MRLPAELADCEDLWVHFSADFGLSGVQQRHCFAEAQVSDQHQIDIAACALAVKRFLGAQQHQAENAATISREAQASIIGCTRSVPAARSHARATRSTVASSKARPTN